MKEFNNDKFNRSLKEKFKGAQYEPSNAVWDGIETELLRVENEKMRKKAVWYRNIAAAVILLAMVSLYYNLANQFTTDFLRPESQLIDLRETNYTALSERSEDKLLSPTIVNDVILSKDEQSRLKESSSFNKRQEQINSGDKKVTAMRVAFASLEEGAPSEASSSLNLLNKLERNGADIEADLSLSTPAELGQVSFFAISELADEKVKQAVNFEANVLFGSGNFNPDASVTEGSPALSSAFVSNTTNFASRNDVSDIYNERQKVEELSSAPMKSNLSLTYGFNVGVNIGKRMTIKSGLNFGKYRSTSESSVVLRDINSDQLYPYHGASSAAQSAEGKVVNVTSPYNLYNDFEMISIPLQFSYKVFDSNFDISLMTGATADFLLSNTLTGASDQLNIITFSQDEESAYRNVFASGLVGLELSYALGKHYGLSLTPQFKKALTDITKNGAGFYSAPTFASVNMSFQYIF